MVGAQCLHNVANLVVAVVHLLLPLRVLLALLAVLALLVLVPDRRNMQMKSPKHHALIIKPKNSN